MFTRLTTSVAVHNYACRAIQLEACVPEGVAVVEINTICDVDLTGLVLQTPAVINTSICQLPGHHAAQLEYQSKLCGYVGLMYAEKLLQACQAVPWPQ